MQVIVALFFVVLTTISLIVSILNRRRKTTLGVLSLFLLQAIESAVRYVPRESNEKLNALFRVFTCLYFDNLLFFLIFIFVYEKFR